MCASGPQVLIADDVKLNRTLMKRNLSEALPSASFKLVDSGEEALRRLCAAAPEAGGAEGEAEGGAAGGGARRERRYDLAVLDQSFAVDVTTGERGISGTEVTRRVRRHEAAAAAARSRDGAPAPRPLVVVGYTGHAGPEHSRLVWPGVAP